MPPPVISQELLPSQRRVTSVPRGVAGDAAALAAGTVAATVAVAAPASSLRLLRCVSVMPGTEAR
ncbi:hypothetical protein Afil01_30350 [Actinorhabdospora filicis]|uniref:Uncharacterized protein n=1 Tax=Actinorhabdospora filicis TaxID=1785913 RepID=A0A9W6SL36_9ACTN|nr:hypothetical protein Afil01_30350 [Actinorhabdospora filicis]